MVAIMAADHPLVSRPYLRARDFADEDVILYVSPEESTFSKNSCGPPASRRRVFPRCR